MTNEEIKFEQQIVTPWGVVSLEKDKDGTKKYKFNKADFLKLSPDNQEKVGLKSVQLISDQFGQHILVDGKEMGRVNDLKEKAQIKEVHFDNVLETESGETL
ncbi:MAG: hypothetical protein WCG67_08195, partial [Ferruginibacter sp.]